MWPFSWLSGPSKGSPEWFGEQLYSNCVENEVASYDPNEWKLKLPKHIKPLFFAKLRVYHEASILRVLLTDSQKNNTLLREFEKQLFGTTWTPTAATKLDALKIAVRSLDELFLDSNKAGTWARSWLLDIGYDETNPAVLLAFGGLMANKTKTLREMIPQLSKILVDEYESAPSH
jgi:hypothetical protein